MNDMPFITEPLRSDPLIVEKAAFARAEQLVLQADNLTKWRAANKRLIAAKHALLAAEVRRG